VTAPAPSERDLAVLRSFARRIDASDAGAHNNLGVLYYQKGLVPEAIAEFTRALELDPKMQVAQRNLEIAYHNSGYYDQRVSELQERLRAAPDDRDARWELGRAYAILGAADDAVSEFEQILAHRPKDVAAMLQIGQAEKARGRLEVATEWFVRARELEPDSTVVHFYLGEVYYNRGLNSDALAALERAVALNAENANAHYLMAFVLGDMGRHQEARAASKRAIQLNPPLARAQTNLSLERYNAERKSQQLRMKERPEPEVAEGSALAHYNLGRALQKAGRTEEAATELAGARHQNEKAATRNSYDIVKVVIDPLPGQLEVQREATPPSGDAWPPDNRAADDHSKEQNCDQAIQCTSSSAHEQVFVKIFSSFHDLGKMGMSRNLLSCASLDKYLLFLI